MMKSNDRYQQIDELDSPGISDQGDLIINELNRSYGEAPAWKDLMAKKKQITENVH